MGIPKMPKVPDPAPAPPPPPQLSSTAVLGSAQDQELAAAKAAGRGMSGTILTGPNGLFDGIGATPKAKSSLIGAGA